MSYNSEDYFNSKDFKALLSKFEEGEKSGQQVLLDPEDYTDIQNTTTITANQATPMK